MRLRLPVWPWRRLVQISALAVTLALPVVARYQNYLSARQLDKVMEKWDGSLQGKLLVQTDRALRLGIPDGEGGVPTRRPRKAILERTRDWYGSPWSARVAGETLTDPLAVAESGAASRSFVPVLLAGVAIPLLLSVLLGRVYCGWVCPMGFFFDLGAKIRRLLGFLEIRPGRVGLWPWNKYVLLALGLLLAFASGVPFLHALYPPALLGREAHGFVGALFDRAEEGSPDFALVGLSAASVFLLALLAIDVFVAPGFWCRSLCPGAALYSLLGKFRIVRVRRDASRCTPCGLCNKVCPRGLAPMTDATGMECDSCGLCIDVCPDRALKFRAALSSKATRAALSSQAIRAALGLVLLALLAPAAAAHHILGIPHYAYDEDYPQAPVLKLVEQVGDWEFQLTGYPGNPEPGAKTQINVYVVDRRTRHAYAKPLTMDIHRVPAIGEKERVFGPATSDLETNVFKFFPTYPAEGNYEIVVSFDDGATTSTLTFPMVVGEPGSPWKVIAGFGGGILALVVAVRAVRIKRARRREKSAR